MQDALSSLQQKQLSASRDLELDSNTSHQQRAELCKNTIRSKQRKLLIIEIEFLTRFSRPKDVVVYVGATNDVHHKIITEMFPELLFILYDPKPSTIKSTDRREIHRRFFTIQTAQQLSLRFMRENRRILFVSDVETQHVWMEILKPAASLLTPECLISSDDELFILTEYVRRYKSDLDIKSFIRILDGI